MSTNNDEDVLGVKDCHPSYGTLQLSKISSSGMALVGSPLTHHSVVGITLSYATKRTQYGRDYFYADKVVSEIYMSEHQWAEFVCSFGSGEGVPVTFSHKPSPGYTLDRVDLPRTTTPRGRHTADVQKGVNSAKEVVAKLNSLVKALHQKPVAKIKKDDIEALNNAATQVNNWLLSNLPFIQECFEEAMEKTIASAKAEVVGFTSSLIQRAGLEHLGAVAPILMIDEEPGS